MIRQSERYLIRSVRTGVYIGDNEQGKVSVTWDGMTHVFESGADRATRFTRAEAYKIIAECPQFCFCPEHPGTCTWD